MILGCWTRAAEGSWNNLLCFFVRPRLFLWEESCSCFARMPPAPHTADVGPDLSAGLFAAWEGGVWSPDPHPGRLSRQAPTSSRRSNSSSQTALHQAKKQLAPRPRAPHQPWRRSTSRWPRNSACWHSQRSTSWKLRLLYCRCLQLLLSPSPLPLPTHPQLHLWTPPTLPLLPCLPVAHLWPPSSTR